MKKVSVIIPTYKRSMFLIRAINSVLSQTYENIEIIVVDDNGIGTEFQLENENKLRSYINDKKIVYLKHDVNKNGAAARNTGIRKSSGEYITFLDDDDFFLKDRIELLVNKLNQNNEYDCIYSSMVKIKNKHIYNYRKGNKQGNLLEETLCQYSFFGTGSNMFFTRKSIMSVGEFDESFFRFQDLEYMTRFFEKGFNVCAIDKVLVVKCEEDSLNVLNYNRLKIAKGMYIGKFGHLINKLDYNKIMYSIYKELYIFSSNSKELNESKKLVTKYKKISFKDRLIHIYNSLTLKSNIINYLNYKIREVRCLGKYTADEKKEIFTIINSK